MFVFFVYLGRPPADKRHWVILFTLFSWLCWALLTATFVVLFVNVSDDLSVGDVLSACYVGFAFSVWELFCNVDISWAVAKESQIARPQIYAAIYAVSQLVMFIVDLVVVILLRVYFYTELGAIFYPFLVLVFLKIVLTRFFTAYYTVLVQRMRSGQTTRVVHGDPFSVGNSASVLPTAPPPEYCQQQMPTAPPPEYCQDPYPFSAVCSAAGLFLSPEVLSRLLTPLRVSREPSTLLQNCNVAKFRSWRRHWVILFTLFSWLCWALLTATFVVLFVNKSYLGGGHPVLIACYVGFAFSTWELLCNVGISIAVAKESQMARPQILTSIYVVSELLIVIIGEVGLVFLKIYYDIELGAMFYPLLVFISLKFLAARFFIAYDRVLVQRMRSGQTTQVVHGDPFRSGTYGQQMPSAPPPEHSQHLCSSAPVPVCKSSRRL
ncbi:hypothetical protein QR680_007977 [Steinernema hermaphroditum]|uniref:Transmembrane protein n=1 Tax=Steinernema hermaphroditum TaxID=289476 RepID=A0AA39IEV4_9BILA|nr:hypothetical protein QR680_007977 [Steinernema hermaphroditum]